MKMTRDELVQELRILAACIAQDDSLEGSFTYRAADFHVYEVEASYRVGNSEGQGSVRLIQAESDK